MAEVQITNYTELLAAGSSWLNRADLEDQMPAFVSLAEAQFNRDLRVRQMMVRASTTSTAENVALPIDFLEHYSLSLESGTPGPMLRYMSEGESNELKASAAGMTGPVKGYTMIGNGFELVPPPAGDTDLRMVYYAAIPPLRTAGTNWLLTKSPDLYLFGMLMQSAPYLKDDQRLGAWAQTVAGLMEAMRMESERSMRPTSGLIAKARM